MKKKNNGIKKIITMNQKGGVGKSATVINLSYLLAKNGFKTLVVDLDAQAHLSKIYAHEIEPDRTIGELMLNKKADIREFIIPARLSIEIPQKDESGETEYLETYEDIENLSIIPSDIHLSVASEQILSLIHREKLLHNHLKKIEQDYDYIICDCPPALSVLTQNAIFAADSFLIPTDFGSNSLDGVSDIFSSIEEILDGTEFHYKILRTMKSAANKRSNRVVEDQLSDFKGALLKTIIRRNEHVNQAQFELMPVYKFNPRCNGSVDYLALMEEVLAYE